jgi:2-amino-4-hydroxy-6-hydroxymethyldihydropteridine diphosphokinase
MQFLNKAYLLIGGNVGDMILHLHQATELLNLECGKIDALSSIYETAAWGNVYQPPFLNQALLLKTPFTAPALMTKLLLIEEKMGRKRLEKYGPRLIDIDILLFNNEIHESASLTIPHPELQNRMFALIPLAEIAGGFVHPVFKKSISRLLQECKDELEVVKLDK